MKCIKDFFKSKHKKEREKYDNMTIREKIEYIVNIGIDDNYYYPFEILTDEDIVILIVVNKSLGFIRARINPGFGVDTMIQFDINTSPEIIYQRIFTKEYRKEKLKKIKDIL